VKTGNDILSFESLEIGYTSGKRAMRLLPPLSASAGEGELIAIIGRNGIGKSTLLRSLIGLQPSLGGRIRIMDKDINEYPKLELAKLTGYISTEIVRAGNMRVYDLVSLGRYPHTNWIGIIDPESHKVIIESIKITGVEELQKRFISELSDGERQKAMIARMIAQESPLMIMDEPTAFLDISGKYDVISLLLKLTRKGKTIIFSTHDFNVAINQADKIWLLLENRLIEGSPEDLMLCGAFDNLFDSSVVRFNHDDGNFTFRSKYHGEIYIHGTGLIKHWTEKAVIRAGFSVAEKKTSQYIEIQSDEKKQWILHTGERTTGFDSIYELLKYLR
jgi:iron complex transport system ATP-binding protein